MSRQWSLGKLEVSIRRCGLPGFISVCHLHAVFLFGVRMGENFGGLSVSPELFRYVVDRCAVERLL